MKIADMMTVLTTEIDAEPEGRVKNVQGIGCCQYGEEYDERNRTAREEWR